MTTADSIFLTQIPIALACFWLAYELRRMRQSLVRKLDELPPAPDETEDDGPTGGGAAR